MLHKRFAVPLAQKIHTGKGNTKFWHKSGFRNVVKKSAKIAATALIFLEAGAFFSDLMAGELSPAGMAGLPEPDFDGIWWDEFELSIMDNDFDQAIRAISMIDDLTVEFLTVDEMIQFENDGVMPQGLPGGSMPSQSDIDEYPYMKILYKGETIGIIETPDNVETK